MKAQLAGWSESGNVKNEVEYKNEAERVQGINCDEKRDVFIMNVN